MVKGWRESYDSEDSEDYGPRPKGGVRKQRCQGRKPKEASFPWSEEEMERLLTLVEARLDPITRSDEQVNWGDIAARLGNRTAKQCREKFRNDLRPDITKAPWTLEEEYILAVAHSQLGNKWSDIAKFLPRRAENTIKNHWYATMRAKADSKTRTFLWLYGQMASRDPDPYVLREAKEKYAELAEQQPDVYPPLHTFEVPEDHFTTGLGSQQAAMLQQAELAATLRGPHAAPIRSATARAALTQAATQGTSTGGAITMPSTVVGAGSGAPRRTRTSQDSVCAGAPSGVVVQTPAGIPVPPGPTGPGVVPSTSPFAVVASGAVPCAPMVVPPLVPIVNSEVREQARRAAVAAATASGAMPGVCTRETRNMRRSTSPSRMASLPASMGTTATAMAPSTAGAASAASGAPMASPPAAPPPAAPAPPPPAPRMARPSFDGDASCLVKLPSMGLPPKAPCMMPPRPPPPRASSCDASIPAGAMAHYGGVHHMQQPQPMGLGPIATASHGSGSYGASHAGMHPMGQPQVPPQPPQAMHHQHPTAHHIQHGHPHFNMHAAAARGAMAPMHNGMQGHAWNGGAPGAAGPAGHVLPLNDDYDMLWAESLAGGAAAELMADELLAEFLGDDDDWAVHHNGAAGHCAPAGMCGGGVVGLQHGHGCAVPVKAEACELPPAPPVKVEVLQEKHTASEGLVMQLPAAMVRQEDGPRLLGQPEWPQMSGGMMGLQGVLCSPPRHQQYVPAFGNGGSDTPVSTARTGCRPAGAVSRFASAAAQPLPFRVPAPPCFDSVAGDGAGEHESCGAPGISGPVAGAAQPMSGPAASGGFKCEGQHPSFSGSMHHQQQHGYRKPQTLLRGSECGAGLDQLVLMDDEDDELAVAFLRTTNSADNLCAPPLPESPGALLPTRSLASAAHPLVC